MTRRLFVALLILFAVPAFATVTGTSSRVTVVTDGLASSYGFTFQVTSASDVEVYIDNVKQTTGFTVTINANQATNPGGTVTFLAPPSASAYLKVQRAVPLTQLFALSPYSPFKAKSFENTFDKVTMQIQQVDRKTQDLADDLASTQAYLSGVLAGIGVPPPQAPSFSRASGFASPSESLAISTNSIGAVIYYTTDGTMPTTSSSIYLMPIPLAAWSDGTVTIKALAYPATGWTPSDVSSVTLSIPWFSQLANPGCYPTPQVWGDALWTITRSSTQTRSGGTISCANNELTVEAEGAAIYKASVQLHPSPAAPATGTVTFTATGAHTFSVIGTGSQTISLGTATGTGFPCTATQAAPCALTVASTGTATVSAVAGALSFAQVEAGAYATPQILAAGATRAVTLASSPLPTMGSNWCVQVRARATGREWYIGGNIASLLVLGAHSGANTANLTLNGGSLIWSIYDGSAGVKQVTWTIAAVAGSAHTVAACNESGTPSLYFDGTSVGTVSGAGTGVWGAQPATLYLGSTASSIRQWDGHLRDLTICHQAASVSECVTAATGTPLAALGDSITLGSGLGAPYPVVVKSLITGAWLLNNYGVGGYTTSQVLGLWTSTVRPLAPPRVMLMAGVNDVRTGVTAAVAWANLKTIVDQAVADGATVSLGTVTPFYGRAEWTAGREVERLALNASILAYCTTSSIRCFDAATAVADPADPKRILPAYDQGDAIHPNQAGANIIAAQAALTFP